MHMNVLSLLSNLNSWGMLRDNRNPSSPSGGSQKSAPDSSLDQVINLKFRSASFLPVTLDPCLFSHHPHHLAHNSLFLDNSFPAAYSFTSSALARNHSLTSVVLQIFAAFLSSSALYSTYARGKTEVEIFQFFHLSTGKSDGL